MMFLVLNALECVAGGLRVQILYLGFPMCDCYLLGLQGLLGFQKTSLPILMLIANIEVYLFRVSYDCQCSLDWWLAFLDSHAYK